MTANTTALTYNGYISQIATMAVVNTTTESNGLVVGVDPAFNAIIPQMLNYAELRIQRDLDLLQLEYNNTNYNMSTGTNIVQVSVDDFVTIQTVSYAPSVTGGASIPVMPVSKNFIQNVASAASTDGPPQYWAVFGGDSTGSQYQNLLFGPSPDQNYRIYITGTQRMPTLYNYANGTQCNNNTNWISTYLPDLLIAASMIYISGFQRNFGRMSDDPTIALSWEAQYQNLLTSAKTENYRARWESGAWSSSSPSPIAAPTR